MDKETKRGATAFQEASTPERFRGGRGEDDDDGVLPASEEELQTQDAFE